MGATGHRRGIHSLVDQHYESLYRYAYRLSGGAADAEDLTQEAFCKAQAQLSQLRDLEQTPELPAGPSASSSAEQDEAPAPDAQSQPTSQPVQVGAPPAGAPAFPGAQPSGGFGAYGQPSEYQGFAGN